MTRTTKYLAGLVVAIGIVAVAIGAVFVYQSITVNGDITEALEEEHITIGGVTAEGEIVNSAALAQRASDTIKEHRRSIAPTYADLLGSGRFDPTNPQHITYNQALTMEGLLNMAVMGYGVATIALAAGIFMIVVGFALGAAGAGVYVLAAKAAEAEEHIAKVEGVELAGRPAYAEGD